MPVPTYVQAIGFRKRVPLRVAIRHLVKVRGVEGFAIRQGLGHIAVPLYSQPDMRRKLVMPSVVIQESTLHSTLQTATLNHLHG